MLLEGLSRLKRELTKADWKTIRSEAMVRVQARSKAKRSIWPRRNGGRAAAGTPYPAPVKQA